MLRRIKVNIFVLLSVLWKEQLSHDGIHIKKRLLEVKRNDSFFMAADSRRKKPLILYWYSPIWMWIPAHVDQTYIESIKVALSDEHTSIRAFWLAGFGFDGLLRCYFSLFWAVSERGQEKREKKDERKMSKQLPTAPTASAIGPCPTITLSKK